MFIANRWIKSLERALHRQPKQHAAVYLLPRQCFFQARHPGLHDLREHLMLFFQGKGPRESQYKIKISREIFGYFGKGWRFLGRALPLLLRIVFVSTGNTPIKIAINVFPCQITPKQQKISLRNHPAEKKDKNCRTKLSFVRSTITEVNTACYHNHANIILNHLFLTLSFYSSICALPHFPKSTSY